MAARARSAGPAQLATRVHSFLQAHGEIAHRMALQTLFVAMYGASFETEEGHPIRLEVIVGDPEQLQMQVEAIDQLIGPRVVRDSWLLWPLGEPISLTIDTLTKISRATDARSSAICVAISSGRPVIWGFVDQQELIHTAMSWDAENRPIMRPGVIQVTVENIAHLTVWAGYHKVAELKGASLVPPDLDALQGGPLRTSLEPGVQAHLAEVQAALGMSGADFLPHQPLLSRLWFAELSRLLHRIESYRSGGALLITPDTTLAGLDVRYMLAYDRLRSALRTRAVNTVQLRAAARPSAARAWLLRTRDRARNELDGATRFVSLLTRVDGLVLLDPSLDVRGFGVRISTADAPPAAPGGQIPLATNRGATTRAMGSIDYAYYGTRHQSMFRYCQSIDGSVGFVLSQDGAVRAVTKVRGVVTMWSGIQLMREARPRRGNPRNLWRATSRTAGTGKVGPGPTLRAAARREKT